MAQANQDPVAAVSLKLPTFWQTNPAGWFYTVEAQFHVRNITADDTKFYYVVAALESDAATAITSLLRNPPADNKFQAIKTALLKVYEPSDRQKKHLLLTLSGLGDRKPSELLRYMQTLHETDKGDLLFMALFMQQLPPPVRAILSARDFDDVAKLAEAADEVLREHSDLPTATVRAMPRPKLPAKDRPQEPGLCYYHRRFGASAKKCTSPCTWSGNERASH